MCGVRGVGGRSTLLRSSRAAGRLVNTLDASESGRRWPCCRPNCCWCAAERVDGAFSPGVPPLQWRARDDARVGVQAPAPTGERWAPRMRTPGERGGDATCVACSGCRISRVLESSTIALAASSSTGGTEASIASCGERARFIGSMLRSKMLGSGDARGAPPAPCTGGIKRDGVSGSWGSAAPGCRPRPVARPDTRGERGCDDTSLAVRCIACPGLNGGASDAGYRCITCDACTGSSGSSFAQ